MAAGAGGELCHRAKSRVDWLPVWKWREAAGADRLVSVDLREVGLVHGASAHVLRLHAAGVSKLMLDAEAPLHEVRSMELAVRDGSHGNRRKAGRGIRQRRCARELTLREPGNESLIGRDGGIDGTVGNAGRDGGAADAAQQATLKCLYVRRIHSDQVGNAARQDVTKNSEAGAQHGVPLELPGDCRSRLQNRQGSGDKEIAEASLYCLIQRLIDIVQDGVERTIELRNLIMRVERVGIVCVAQAER